MRPAMFALVAFLVLAISGSAKTIHIPQDYPTIQQGIDASINGDTVLVWPGFYVENIDFKGRSIIVKSKEGPDETLIDGQQMGSVVTFNNNEDLDSILDGFTIQNGIASKGGGVYCKKSSPTLTNNYFLDNISEEGGGLFFWGGSPLIDNNLIMNNRAELYGGGGITCFIYSTATITNNTISDNFTWGNGGGISIVNSSSPIIKNNLILNNESWSSGGGLFIHTGSPIVTGNLIKGNQAIQSNGDGGGIHCNGASAIISNNTINDNASGYSGGGVYCIHSTYWEYPIFINNLVFNNSAAEYGGGFSCHSCSPILRNNTIVQNSAFSGGGFECINASSPELLNTILYNNSALRGKEIIVRAYSNPSTLTISYSDVKGGQGSVHIEPGSTLNWGAGMIDADPLFVDTSNNDFHLTWLSPCINMGTNDGAPSEDMDGDLRPTMGTVDIGADEYTDFHRLECDAFTLSESQGGLLNFILNGGIPNAGRQYLIYASVSGTAPGISLPGHLTVLPINWDPFTNIVVNLCYPNSIYFTGFFSTLDPNGQMIATFNTNGPVPSLSGYTMSFAYPLQGPPWDFVSNPINVEVVP